MKYFEVLLVFLLFSKSVDMYRKYVVLSKLVALFVAWLCSKG